MKQDSGQWVALMVLAYSCNFIHWRTTNLQQLDRQTRNLFTHCVHHPVADVDWLYALYLEGGRGLQQIESTYQSCIVGCTVVTFMTVLIPSCRWHRSVILGGSLIQTNAWHGPSVYCTVAGDSGRDNMLQNLYGSGTISCDGVFQQAPQADEKHLHMCSSSLLCTVLQEEAYVWSVLRSH